MERLQSSRVIVGASGGLLLLMGGLACSDASPPQAPAPRAPGITIEAHDAYFPIGPGTKHAGGTCNQCHGAFESFQGFDCLGCHTHAESVISPRHRSVADYEYTSAKCFSCHPRGEVPVLDRESHPATFPISAGSAHADAACGQCHTESADRSKLSCLGCHPHAIEATERAHVFVSDYEETPAQCLRCHEGARVAPVLEHDRFPIGWGDHRASRLGCLKCHDAQKPAPVWAADFTQANCFNCHPRGEMVSEHRGMPTFSPTTEACLRCHPNGNSEDGEWGEDDEEHEEHEDEEHEDDE